MKIRKTMAQSETERLITQASELANQGRFPEAKELCERICRSDPDNAVMWNTLGAINGQLGELEEAESCCREALRIQPDFPGACLNLGNALVGKGQLEEAIASYRQATVLQPNFVQAWARIGDISAQSGNWAEAESACRQAVSLSPDLADAHFVLAHALYAQHKPAEAIVAYRRGLRHQPANHEAHARLGWLLQEEGRYAEAQECHERTLRLKPGQPAVLRNLGICRQQLKRFKEAEESFRELLRLESDSVDTIGRLAYLCERSHQVDEARDLVHRGLALDPESTALLLTQARLVQREGHFEAAIGILERVLQRKVEPELLGEIYARLGLLYDQTGDYARAFSCFDTGNQCAGRIFHEHGVDKHSYLRELRQVTGLFADDPPRSSLPKQRRQVPDAAPVFLIGFPRSGTTLLDQILDAHVRLWTLEEKPAVAAMTQAFFDLAGGRDDALAGLTSKEILQLRKIYFSTTDQFIERRPDRVLVDKLPLNISRAHLIWRVFPDAKFILALRHPCDVCLSCFMHNFGANTAMANFLTLEDTVNLYATVMGFWRQCVRALPLQYHAVKYEDIVTDLESEIRALLDFLGVDWDDAVLAYTDHAKKRGVIDTPSYLQVTQPIYQHAKYRWERYAEYLEPHMDRLAPFIEYFGYPRPE